MRKKKTQEIVKAKRRKIIEALSKGKSQYSGQVSGNAVVEMEPDENLSIEELEKQLYQGYPPWRKDKYKAQNQILTQIITENDWKAF